MDGNRMERRKFEFESLCTPPVSPFILSVFTDKLILGE